MVETTGLENCPVVMSKSEHSRASRAARGRYEPFRLPRILHSTASVTIGRHLYGPRAGHDSDVLGGYRASPQPARGDGLAVGDRWLSMVLTQL